MESPAEFLSDATSIEPRNASLGPPASEPSPEPPAMAPHRHACVEPKPPERPALLDPAAFSRRLQLAIERQHAEGVDFTLHRLSFDAPEVALDELLRELPGRMRSSDGLCRQAPLELLVLCVGAPDAFARIWRRMEALWAAAWARHGGPDPVPAVEHELISLTLPPSVM